MEGAQLCQCNSTEEPEETPTPNTHTVTWFSKGAEGTQQHVREGRYEP